MRLALQVIPTFLSFVTKGLFFTFVGALGIDFIIAVPPAADYIDSPAVLIEVTFAVIKSPTTSSHGDKTSVVSGIEHERVIKSGLQDTDSYV